MAKKTAQVDVKVTGQQTIAQLEDELSKVNEELRNMDTNSQAFADMSVKAQQLEGELQGVEQQLSYISPAEQADGFLKMGEGILGSVAAVQGLTAAFGGSTEAMEETIKKLVGLVAAMDGLRKVSEALQRENLQKLSRGLTNMRRTAVRSYNALGTAITTANKKMASMVGVSQKAARGINTALASIGILALITAITAVINNWDKLVKVFQRGDGVNEIEDRISSLNEELEVLDTRFSGLSDTISDIKSDLDTIGTLELFDVDLLNENEDLFYEILRLQHEIANIQIELKGLESGTLEFLEKQEQLLIKQQELERINVQVSRDKKEVIQEQNDEMELFRQLQEVHAAIQGRITEDGEVLTEGLEKQVQASRENLQTMKEELQVLKIRSDITWDDFEAVRMISDYGYESIEQSKQLLESDELRNSERKKLERFYELEARQQDVVFEQLLRYGELNLTFNEAERRFYQEKQAIETRLGKNRIENLEESIQLEQEFYDTSKSELDILRGQYNDIQDILERLVFEPNIKEAVGEVNRLNLALQQTRERILELTKRDPIKVNVKPVGVELPPPDTLEPIPITITTDLTNWEKFQHQFQTDWDRLKEITEDWGAGVAAFTEEYLAPIANEINNLVLASADLYAAQQDQVIALAELEIQKQEEVAEAEREEIEKTQDLLEDSKSREQELLELAKDANAERYAEIQQQILAEQQLQRDLQSTKDEAAQQEKEANDEIMNQQYEIALAEWRIGKKDLEASKVTAGIQGALAVIQALASPFPLNTILPLIIGAATATQIAAINTQLGTYDQTKPEKAEEGMLVGASHAGGGIPIEAEGGEYIVNKRSTSAFLPLIEAINDAGRRPKFAEGGQVANVNRQDASALINYDELAQAITRSVKPVVSVVEITDAQNRVDVIQGNASF